MPVGTTSQAPTVDRYAPMYPDVPVEVILKEDLLRLGVGLTPAAMEAAENTRTQAYFLFSYNISAHSDLDEGVSTTAPEDFQFSGGPYDLKRTWVRVVLNRESPYVIDVVEGRLMVCENGTPVADVKYPVKPAYYGRTFDDGMLYEQVIPLLYDSYAFITTFRACHYWGDKEECKFCDINHNLREVRKLSGDHVTADAIKDKDRVVEVLAAMVEEPIPGKRLITIIMIGGSIVRKVRGGPDNAADFNAFVAAIRERIGSRIPIVMITESQPMDRLQRLVDAGITSHNANLEVWDERLFKIYSPGKQKYIGYDVWVRRLLEAVDILGEGRISPLDFLIRTDIAWYETWRKYRLPPFEGYGPMGGGPGVAVYGNSASVDFGG